MTTCHYVFWISVTDAYSSPFIAECVFAAVEHLKFRQKVLRLYEEIVDEKDDLEPDSATRSYQGDAPGSMV
jgi:hypothetical protein